MTRPRLILLRLLVLAAWALARLGAGRERGRK